MDTCVRCGAELGVGRFCLNCGHRIGDPAPASARPPAPRAAAPAAPPPSHPTRPTHPSTSPPAPTAEVAEAPPVEVPVQAADPTPVPPTRVPEPARARRGRRRPDAGPAPAPTPGPSAWDPDEDLLPYHDADELGPDEPLPPRGWILWVGGAVALVAVALLLLRVLDTTDDDTGDAVTDTSSAAASAEPTTGEEGGEEQPTVPQGVGERFDAATGATFGVPATAPPTTDLDGDLVAYDAAQMGDGIPATAWRTAGSAAGQAITVTLAGPTVVDRVGLVNGYAKQVEGVDWYPNNRRILSVTWTFDDGTTVEQTLAERPGLQRVEVPPVTTSTVTLTLGEVTPPGAGPLGRDYTAISEVSVLGRRAG